MPRNGVWLIRFMWARRYQLAIRLDTDLRQSCSRSKDSFARASSADVLESMARHVTEGGQGAFTWTVAVWERQIESWLSLLSAALNGDTALRRHAASIFGPAYVGAPSRSHAAANTRAGEFFRW